MAEQVPGAYAHRRATGTDDTCPRTQIEVLMDLCESCRFYRGATSRPGEGRQWNVLCNWPQDGSYREVIATEVTEVPDIFKEAFE